MPIFMINKEDTNFRIVELASPPDPLDAAEYRLDDYIKGWDQKIHQDSLELIEDRPISKLKPSEMDRLTKEALFEHIKMEANTVECLADQLGADYFSLKVFAVDDLYVVGRKGNKFLLTGSPEVMVSAQFYRRK